MALKMIIFDFVGTLYNPKEGSLYTEAIPVLEFLKKKYSLVLITKSKKNRRKLIDSLSIRHYFDDVIIKKKKVDLFRQQIYLRGYEPEQCLIVGDEDEEVHIAKELNTQCILIDRENQVLSEKKIGDLFELCTLLLRHR